MTSTRRDLLLQFSAAAAVQGGETIAVDPTPQFEISPSLYMQFMEPLGVTDSSVEAAWDYETDNWRADFVEATADLAPGMLRFGGIFSRYYRWREGVGPPERRPAMLNHQWGGKETNRVGTAEFVNLCRRVKAEPVYCVNFLSDGHRRLWNTPQEGNRSGDAREAADWVSYANDPGDKLRRSHGHTEPLVVRFWQLGNETSYGKEGFTREEAIGHTVEFAKAMRARDPSIQLIGWGDHDARLGGELWAPAMIEQAGQYLNLIAIHLMGQSPRRPDTVLRGLAYQHAPETAWNELLELAGNVEKRVSQLEQVLAAKNSALGIAVTEGHLSLSPHNSNPILLEWLSAAYHAVSLNTYQRHGSRVKIATGADFCGNRWTVNALMIPVPRGTSYLTPAGSIMRLFGRHNGAQGLRVTGAPSALDVAASRTGNRIFLHVLNKEYSRALRTQFRIPGFQVQGGAVHEIAPENPREYVNQDLRESFVPRRKPLTGDSWTFPPRSVSAVELDISVLNP